MLKSLINWADIMKKNTTNSSKVDEQLPFFKAVKPEEISADVNSRHKDIMMKSFYETKEAMKGLRAKHQTP